LNIRPRDSRPAPACPPARRYRRFFQNIPAARNNSSTAMLHIVLHRPEIPQNTGNI